MSSSPRSRQMMGRRDQSPSVLFSLILSALGSGAASPAEVQVILRHGNALGLHAFRVNKAMNAQVIAKLKTVFLTLDAPGLATPAWEDSLRRFFHAAADLESLRLNFDNRPSPNQLDWLGTAPATTNLVLNDPAMLGVPSAPLRNLTQLDIGMLFVTGSSLVRVLCRFKLKSFSLWKVTLACESRASQSHNDHWREFISALSKALGTSSSIAKALIGHCAQRDIFGQSASHERVHFCPQGTDDKAKMKSKELQNEAKYRAHYGSSISHWLEALAERTYVPSIHAPPPVIVSDNDDSDDPVDDSNEDDEDDEEDDEDENMDDAE